MTPHRPLPLLALAALLALTAGTPLAARASAAPGNPDALRGVTSGKGLFLVDLADGPKIAMYLKLIAGSHDGLRAQGVAPDFKVVFIGPTVRFLTGAAPAPNRAADRAAAAEIAAAVRELKRRGAALEVCAIATKVFQVEDARLLPELTVVADGFVSLIGYQAQGYHLVPIY
ncbi:Domain of unknown function DUF1791 [Anaeromyxobacter sp. K]|uniref:DsrE family protein n=1 Tax=Anaeromyxobacter sp. (strain K) TaxID=447217 RepID=UPI00015F9D2C|nr:DsrE family protein [Anaeromyxobacter sp. K]ACG71480.1 Domain of unknown function DUF1791 [Anaeromyxobacter sp. K]